MIDKRLFGKIFSLLLITTTLNWASADAQEQADPFDENVRWCAVDDPATFRELRQQLAAEGAQDDSQLRCPERRAALGALPEVLSLPMPCGRTMVFQRIDVPVDHMLDHDVGSFGRDVDEERETVQITMSSGAWQAPVAGGFTLSDNAADGSTGAVASPTALSYYLSRYETTKPQAMLWQMGLLGRNGPGPASDDPGCGAYQAALEGVDLRNVIAAGGFSWYDAIAFGRDYTEWLLTQDFERLSRNELPLMPWEEGATGVIRPPSEAEWEYAARGGAEAVTAQARSLLLPKIVDPITGEARAPMLDEVCADAPRRVNDDTVAVGRKKPNLLGLYDVVCNAEEIVLDLFRMTRPDGLHGQIGGYLTKGGSSKIGRERVSIGMRVEKELFRVKGEQRIVTSGVRLAIGAPAFAGRRDANEPFVEGMPNEPLNSALSAGRAELLDSSIGPGQESRQDLNREIAGLREQLQATDLDRAQLEARLARLAGTVDSLNTALNDRARDNARQLIRAGVVAANLIDRIGRNMYFVLAERRTLLQGDRLNAQMRRQLDLRVWQERMGRNRTRIDATFDLYLSIQLELGREQQGFVADQLRMARTGLTAASFEAFSDNLDVFEQHQAEVRQSRGAVTESMREKWIYQLDAVRSLRDQEFPEFR